MKITAGLILAGFTAGLLGGPHAARADLLTYDYDVTGVRYDFGLITPLPTGMDFSGTYTIDTSLGGFPTDILIGMYVQNPTPLNWGGLISFHVDDGDGFTFGMPISSAYYLSVGGPNDIVWGSGLDSGLNTLEGGITVNSDLPCYDGDVFTCTYVGSWQLVSDVPEPPTLLMVSFGVSLIGLLGLLPVRKRHSRTS